jgi:hypothetical protein
MVTEAERMIIERPPREPDSLDGELTFILNKHSAENESDSPDHVLAVYLLECLEAFNRAVNKRESWHGRPAPDRR